MVSVQLLNDLSKRSRAGDMKARWKLGWLLYEAEQEGYRVELDKVNEIILIFKRYDNE